MTERRFRVEGALDAGARVPLSSAAGKHARVLRLAVGADVVLFDGRGAEAEAILVSTGDAPMAEVRLVRATRERWHVVLVVGVPKAAALDPLLRGATEAGASEIRLFEAERSVVHADGDRAARKLERWARIVEEAARQSERGLVPPLSLHRSLPEAIADRVMDTRLVGLDARRGSDVRLVLRPPCPASMLVLGPEGGLTDRELALLESSGAVIARAPLPVLRVETAATLLTGLAALAVDVADATPEDRQMR
ncbi:MAG: 16S rRNA (uracil(1498)-N(3))-methyltransferase [Deltaproteobacteria bacterium]|nr:16S rRNA (uracil(1498)-N(3))-methyltransferase [Deltaproteobacteria bacterium]